MIHIKSQALFSLKKQPSSVFSEKKNEPSHKKIVLITTADNQVADQPVHVRSLISVRSHLQADLTETLPSVNIIYIYVFSD